MSSREEILSKVRTIESLPIVAVKVLQMVQEPEILVEKLQHAIEMDPGLTSNILRMSNSAYYKGFGEISTIRDAIVRLGTKTIGNLVITCSIAPVARQPIAGYDMPPGGLLQHQMAIALGSDLLAKRLNIDAPSYTFTAGLLCDLGKIILGTFIATDPKPILDLAYLEGLSFEAAESKVLGVDHTEVGAALLDSWNVPQCIVEAVRWHHQPVLKPGEPSLAVDLVHAADIICHLSGTGGGADGINYTPCLEALNRLQLTNQIAEEVMMAVISNLESMQDVLNIEVER